MIAVSIRLVIRLRSRGKAIGERTSDAIRVFNAARRAQQQVFGEAEDRQIGADADRQRRDRDGGKPRAFAEEGAPYRRSAANVAMEVANARVAAVNAERIITDLRGTEEQTSPRQ